MVLPFFLNARLAVSHHQCRIIVSYPYFNTLHHIIYANIIVSNYNPLCCGSTRTTLMKPQSKLNLCWLFLLNFGFKSHAPSHWYIEGIYRYLSPLTCVESSSILNESFLQHLRTYEVFISHIFHVDNFGSISQKLFSMGG